MMAAAVRRAAQELLEAPRMGVSGRWSGDALCGALWRAVAAPRVRMGWSACDAGAAGWMTDFVAVGGLE